MANLLETSEINRETVDNLITDQKLRGVIHRNRSFILECPDCKKKFYRMIPFLQHREAHKKNRKLHSENKKKQRRRGLLDRLTNNAAFNYEKHTEKLDCNNDITNKEVVGIEHEKNVSLECETQPREEIKIEVKDEFECSGYTLTPSTHYGVHIEKDFVEENKNKHNDKSDAEKRKRHQVKDNALRPFQCEICDRTFARRYSLTTHLRIHTGEKPFKCKICFSRFKSKSALTRHSITQHPENNPYKGQTLECDVCQKKFIYKSDFLNHKRFHSKERPFNCAVCQKGYWTKLDLVLHLKRHTGDKKDFIDGSEYPSFKCEICSKTFTRKKCLKIHQLVHTDDRPFQCKICSSRFKLERILIRHSIAQHPENHPHKGKQSFECEICSKTFTRKDTLKTHQRVHTDDKPFQCKICSSRFKIKPALVKHSYEQHPEDHPYKTKSFECDVCQKKFPYKTDFVSHKRIHTGEKPFNCAVCQKGYCKKLDLVQHLKRHTGNKKDFIDDSKYLSFKCEICSKTFTRKAALKRHQRVHTDDRPLFQCKICSSRFKIEHSLIGHSITQHPENNPYKGKQTFECDVCQKKFPIKSKLLKHKRIHTGKRPFNCAVCQKGYWKKPQLVEHLKNHTGNEKDFVDKSEYSPFACEVCNKTFMQEEKLTRHLQSHTDDRPFQCKICSLRFKTKSVLGKHSYRQHPEDTPYDCKKDYRCDVCQKKFLYKSDMVYHLESHSGKENEKDENLVFERCFEENASLQCEAPTKEEIKIEVKDEIECSEYTLQPFTYHGLHIANNGVEEDGSKHKCNDVHDERKHQVVDRVREDVTDSESRDHCYVEEKLEKHKFNEPYPEVVDIKEDTDSENYTS